MLKRYTLLLLTLPNLLFAANGIANIGVGVKSCGMGGVGIAYPQDSLAGVANPAGLCHIGSRWDIGLTCVYHDAAKLYLIGDQLAVSWEFCRGQTAGVAAVPYGGLYSRGADFKFYYTPLQVVPCWSWRINCAHSVGVSVPVVFTFFESRFGTVLQVSDSVFPNDFTDRNEDVEAGVAFQVGWLGHLNHKLAVGATFRTRTWMSKFKKYQGFFPNQGEADLPPMAGVGVTWHVCPCWIVSGEINHYFWQKVDWLGNVLTQGGEFGSNEGSGFGWSDQTVAKVGVAWDPLPCLELRAGYNYGKQPIGPSEILLNALTLATVEHHATAGVSWTVCRYELSAFYSYGFRNKVKGELIDIENQQQAFGVSIGRLF